MGTINGINGKEKRRILRKRQTPEEQLVWKLLRRKNTGLKWRRQVSIGRYVTDFYCSAKRLAIELDGNQHLETKATDYDHIRDQFFKSVGIAVIRISNDEINGDPAIVYEKIDSMRS